MRAPWILTTLALALGIWLEQADAFAPAYVCAAIAGTVFAIGLATRKTIWVCVMGGMLALGVFLSRQAQQRPAHAVESWAPQECASVEGIVQDLPFTKFHGKSARVQWTLDAENLLRLKMPCEEARQVLQPEKILSRMEIIPVRGAIQVFIVNPKEIPRPGDRIRVFGKFKKPASARHPGEMDYAQILKQRKIYAVFSGLGTAALRTVEPDARLSMTVRIQRLRQWLSLRLDRAFQGVNDLTFVPRNEKLESIPLNAFMKALLLGVRAQVSEGLWDCMIKTGTAHLVAISGLHVTLFLAALCMLFVALGLPQKQVALLALIFSMLYMGIAGFGVPIQRAAFMGVIFYGAILLGREARSLQMLFLACFVILAANPQALRSVSFQLSFLSVFALLCLRPQKVHRPWLEPLRISLAVLAGTLPCAAWHFHLISWAALPANVWAVPLFNVTLLAGLPLLFFADVPGVRELLAQVCAWSLRLGLWGIQWLSKIPAGYSIVSKPSLKKMAIYYFLAGGWLLLPNLRVKNLRLWRLLFLSGWGLSALSFFSAPSGEEFAVTIFSTPEKILAHVRHGRDDWLINPGAVYPSNLTRRLVIPYLHERGIRHLTAVLLTGYGQGRNKALTELMQEVDVAAIYGPQPKSSGKNSLDLGQGLAWKRLGPEQGIEVKAAGFSMRAFYTEKKDAALEIRKQELVLLFLESLDESFLKIFRTRYAQEKNLQICLAVYAKGPETRRNLGMWIHDLKPRALILPEKSSFHAPGQPAVPHVFFLSETGALSLRQENPLSFWFHPYIGTGVSMEEPPRGIWRLTPIETHVTIS